MRVRAQRLIITAFTLCVLLIVLAAVRTNADPFSSAADGTPEQVVLLPEQTAPSAPAVVDAPIAAESAPALSASAPAELVPITSDSAPAELVPITTEPVLTEAPAEPTPEPVLTEAPAEPNPGYLSPVTAVRPFTNALLRWEAAVPAAATLQLELRVSFDGVVWTDWALVTLDDEHWMPEDGPGVFWGQDLYVGEGATFWQVRAFFFPAPDGALPALRRVDVNTVDARFGPAEPAADMLAPALASGVARPAVVSRSAWGSPDGQGSRKPPAYRAVSHLVVHHTAESNSLASGQRWSDRVRAIWSFHAITRGWGDIGYNYLIDPNGMIYEGRAGGDDAVGFHDTANSGSMGVSIIGTYNTVAPSAAAQHSLVELLAWKANQKDIDPHGRSFYYGCSVSTFCNTYNSGALISHISGHRDVTPGRTTCPGDLLMSMLPAIRSRVAERIAASAAPPDVQLELLGVSFDRSSMPSGELLRVAFTVKNSGRSAVEGQAPEAPRDSSSGALNLAESYVYDEAECFLGAPGQSYPVFPKETGRIRLLLGPVDGGRQPVCAGGSGGYPWRWGLNGRLEPGEIREIVGYLRLRTPGPIAIQAGIIHEYVGYLAQNVAPTTITVTPERQMPAPAAFDERLQPLAHVYQLGTPDNLVGRTSDPTAIQRGAYAGSFPWQGEPLNLGEAGPLAANPELRDRFIIEQTRAFLAPGDGLYSFQVAADDAAWLWVNGQLIVSGSNATATIQLPAGRHVLAFKGVERSGLASFGYSVQLPGQPGFGAPPDAFAASAGPRLGASFQRFDGLTLVAADMGGVGVTSLRTSLNGAPWSETPSDIASIGPLPDGSYSLRYMAVDAAGNQSEERTLNFRVDSTLTLHRAFLPIVAR